MSDDIINWQTEVPYKNLADALDYLCLWMPTEEAGELVDGFKECPVSWLQAHTVLSACHLPILTKKDPHVKNDLQRIDDGEELAPIFIVRGCILANAKPLVADGYHRLCAAYLCDPNELVPCLVIDHPDEDIF